MERHLLLAVFYIPAGGGIFWDPAPGQVPVGRRLQWWIDMGNGRERHGPEFKYDGPLFVDTQRYVTAIRMLAREEQSSQALSV
jgi:hypothetical protein